MDPAFDYNMPKGTVLFRAATVEKEGRWFTLSLQDAATYGETITEYTTNKDLKLLNITSLTFHLDFMDRLNIKFPGDNYSGFDHNKIKCLIPFGLVDIESQKKGMSMIGFHMNENTSNWNPGFDYLSSILYNRHRVSEHSLDTYLVTVLEEIYGEQYDGYISPITWPTKLHGGFFPREVCMFKRGNVKEEKEHKRSQLGGTMKHIQTPIPDLSNVDWDKVQMKMNKYIDSIPITPGWNTHKYGTFDDSEKTPVKQIPAKSPKRSTRRKRK